MDEWTKAIAVLPQFVRDRLEQIPPYMKRSVQEIRFQKDLPVTLCMPNEKHVLNDAECTGERLVTTFETLCDFSVHSHQEEIRNGYVTAKNGCRAGIAGTYITENGCISSVRNITSVCFRIRRFHVGCAKDIAFTLKKSGRLTSALICGEPASGKTSVLCDLICELSENYRIAVVDERGELELPKETPCDRLIGCTKADGIEQALRTLAPDGIVFDELGTVQETEAILQCLNSGVATVASIHADGMDTLKRRPAAESAIKSGVFDYAVFLKGRHDPGVLDRIVSLREWEP